MKPNFDLSVINDNDINKLNVYIEKCVINLNLYLNKIYQIHLRDFDCLTSNSEVSDVIRINFSNLFHYLEEGYNLVVDGDLSLKWFFLENFWFLINGESYLSVIEKNNIRDEIEYIEYKLNLLIKKYSNGNVSRFVWL